jgi:ATP/maltotriose-dependent transcriptional regulator MalT
MKYEPVNPPAENVLIRSKLERPPLPGRLVARPRLVERLEKGRDGRVTLVAAPAGYGKTTLALQWLGWVPHFAITHCCGRLLRSADQDV